MKLMLRNEKSANEVIKQRIGEMGKEVHANNYTMRGLEKNTAKK